MKKNIKINYFCNLIYQVFILITPLITTPYVSRVLTSAGIGKYSFTYTIANYFLILGALGFGYYSQREIAKYQDNKIEQSKIFWEILIAKAGSTFISLGIYSLLILFKAFDSEYTLLLWIFSIIVLSSAFDISYFFQGNEEYVFLTLRNVIVKIVGIACIFIFVKTSNDLWIYALSNAIIYIFSNLSLWTRLPKTLAKVNPKELNIKRHIIPTLRLFIPTIACSVYTLLDKTLIGILIPGEIETINESGQVVINKIADVENGYYEQSEKIVKMALTVVTALGTVMIPRNSKEIASGNIETFKNNVNKAISFTFAIGIPIMLGLIAVSDNFSPWFFGEGYDKVPMLIKVLSPIIMIIGLSNIFGLQYLLPLNKDSKYTIAISCGAASNLIMNIILIPHLYALGAAIATIAAESIVTIVMFIFAYKDIDFTYLIKRIWKYLLSGIIMFASVYVTSLFLESSILNTIILIVEGILSYGIMLLIFRDELVLYMLTFVKSIFIKKKAS